MHNLFLFIVTLGMFTLPLRFYFDFRESFC